MTPPPVADSLTKYGSSFQTKIVTCLLTKSDFITTVYDLLQPEQLDTESKQWLTREIKSYFYEYKVLPTLDSLKVKINEITNEILKQSIIDELREVMKHIEAKDLDFIQNETLQNSLGISSYTQTIYPSSFVLNNRTIAGSISQYVGGALHSYTNIQSWKEDIDIRIKAGLASNNYQLDAQLTPCSFTNRLKPSEIYSQAYDYRMMGHPSNLNNLFTY